MKPVTVKDFFLYGEWFDLFWFHAGCPFVGLFDTVRKRLGYGLTQIIGEQQGNILRFYVSRSEWTDIGRRYLEQLVARPELLEKLLSDLRIQAEALIAFSREMKNIPVETLSGAEKTDWLRRYHTPHHTLWSLGQVPNVLEFENSFLADYLKDWLRSQSLDKPAVTEAFQTLSTPRELSQAQKEERALLLLAQSANPGEELIRHWRAYSWLHFGWVGPSLTLEYFQEAYRGLFRSGKAKQQLAELLARDAALVEEKAVWIERLNMPAETVRLFRLLEELLFIKTHRMDALFMSYEAVQPLLRAVAKEHFLSLSQIYALDMEWLLPMLESGTVAVDRINAIADYSVWYFDGEESQLFTGAEAEAVMAPVKAVLPPPPVVNELKGECGFPGLVRGTVCVVNQAKEMAKFADGNILVSNVTDPSLLPIMKKAAAFVTNQGGLTCHAAIVARELHVPCVIGTKIATKVFQDGDRVEVDAERGIVRKI